MKGPGDNAVQHRQYNLKSVAHANRLVSMLSAGVLPGLDEIDENTELSTRKMAIRGGDGQYLQKPQVTVRPSASHTQTADRWVQFCDKAVQRHFQHRVDILSYQFDLVTMVTMAFYMLAYTLCDMLVWGIHGTEHFSRSDYIGRVCGRFGFFTLLLLHAYIHFMKSKPSGSYFKPWTLSKSWVSRSNSLLLTQVTFFFGLHVVDIFSGALWSPMCHYRLLLESIIVIVMRPVEKLAAIITFVICAGIFPFIWFLSTTLSTESSMSTLEPQVMMLPLIFIIMTFGVERLCHYRLVFLALEFVQWSRLQREELESLFKCGNVLYGAMFDKETLKTHDLFMKPSLKDSSHAPPPNKDHDEHGDRGGVTEMLDEQEQKQEGSNASIYAVRKGNESVTCLHNSASMPHVMNGEEIINVQQETASRSSDLLSPLRTEFAQFVTSFGKFEHKTLAELAIAKLNRVVELTEMPVEFEGLIRDAIFIIREGVIIFKTSNLGNAEQQLQQRRTRRGSREQETGMFTVSPSRGSAIQSIDNKESDRGVRQSHLKEKVLGRAATGLTRQSTGSPSRYTLHGFNRGGSTASPSYHGPQSTSIGSDVVVGPLGAAALNSHNRRNLLVKTRTVKNVLDLDLSSSVFSQNLQNLAIDSQKMQRELNEVSFNVFDYAEDPKMAFVACGILVLHDHFMFETFRLDEDVTLRTLQRFADTYIHPDEVPYHSQLHGVEVTQMSHLYLRELYKGDGRESRHACPLDAVHRFALLFGSLVHDLGHPGVNNSFLIETSSHLALQFNDTNVLEAFHVSTCFQTLAMPEYNLFAGLESDEKSKIRTVMIDLILATDLADHFASLKEIETTLHCPGVRSAAPFLEIGGIAGINELKGFVLPNELTGAEQSALGKLLLKSADIGHPSRDFHVHCEWSRRASEEFWRQGDQERRLGLPVNPMNDRKKKDGIAKGQMGFLAFLVAPTHLLLRTVIGHDKLEQLHVNLRRNYQYWAQLDGEKRKEHEKTIRGGDSSSKVAEVSTPVSQGKKQVSVGRVFSHRKPPLPAKPPPED